MGQDKALLPWQNRPLIAHIADILVQVAPPIYVFTSWPARYHAVLGDRVRYVCEQNPGGGPVAAFGQFLAAVHRWPVPPDWVLAVACDLPCLEPSQLQAWRDRAHTAAPAIQAVVPWWQNRWEPLCAFYRPAIATELKKYSSFQDLFRHVTVDAIALEATQAKMLQNCNTLAEFAALSQTPPTGI